MTTFCMAPFSRMTGGPEGTYRTCCYQPPIKKRYTKSLPHLTTLEILSSGIAITKLKIINTYIKN